MFKMQSVHAPQHKSPFSMYFTLSKVSRLNMVNTLLIVTSATFLWRRSESIARPAFVRADEKGRNSVKSRTQKLQEQDGILRDGDEVESRMR